MTAEFNSDMQRNCSDCLKYINGGLHVIMEVEIFVYSKLPF